jgi:outer membrane receptor protein involved in Fe transport
MMGTRNSVTRGVLLLLFWACSSLPAMAQGNVGAIGGTVTDNTGGVLPGANITLSSAQGGTLGASQEVVSDSRGAYQFLQLVPGTYIVRGQLAGFRPVEQQNVVVAAGATARVDLRLQLGQLEESVVVTGEAPLLDTTSALRQTALSQEVLQTLPNRMDVWSITRILPSVVSNKVDVGGSESFQQSSITVRGAVETLYCVDGMNVTGTQGSGSTATFYLDPFAFSDNNIQSGNAPAEWANGGLVFNMISRTGTNQFHGGMTFASTNSGLTFNNITDALGVQILRSVSSAIKALRPDLKPRADLRYLYDDGVWLAGPIKSDSLWFSAAWHHQQNLQYLVGAYNADATSVPDDNYLWTFSGKLAWQISQPSQLTWFYQLQRKVQAHVGTGVVENAATTLSKKTPQLHQVRYSRTFGNKMVMEASGSSMRVHDLKLPTKESVVGDIAGFDQITGATFRALPTYTSYPNARYVAQGNVTYFLTAHDIKVGYQVDYAKNASDAISPTGMRAVYRNGVPDSVNTYNTPVSSEPQNLQQGVYAQDRWRPGRRLTVNLGLRLDTNYGWQKALCQDKTQFTDAKCFPKMSGVPDFKAVNPRFSVIYDLAGDGRTALKFAANRYIVPLGAGVLARVNPIALANDTRPWTVCAAGQTSGCDLNGDKLPQVNELGLSSGFNLGQYNRYADGYSWPYAIEYTVEMQRQLPGNMVVTVGYTRRDKKGNLGSRNEAVPTSTYIPLTVTEVNSGRAITVYNQAPSLRGLQDIVWDNRKELDSSYKGADITFDKRLSNRWMMTGGVSLGKTIGWVGNTDLNNPNSQEFSRGILGNDIPYSFRLSGLYQLPYGISVSGTYQHQKGFAELTVVSVGNNTVALTQGTTTVTVEPRGDVRLPNLNQLDMSVRRAFRFGRKNLQPRIDFYNLANSATIIAWNQTLGSSYHAVNDVQRGRMIKLGVSYDF